MIIGKSRQSRNCPRRIVIFLLALSSAALATAATFTSIKLLLALQLAFGAVYPLEKLQAAIWLVILLEEVTLGPAISPLVINVGFRDKLSQMTAPNIISDGASWFKLLLGCDAGDNADSANTESCWVGC